MGFGRGWGDTGNYWSDYNGNGETPYIIYENNQDNFPVIEPFTIPHEPRLPDTEIYTIYNSIIWFIIIVVAIAAGLVVYFVVVRPLGKNQKQL